MKLGGRPIDPAHISLFVKQAEAWERAKLLVEQPVRKDTVGAILEVHEVCAQGTLLNPRLRYLAGDVLFVPDGHHNARYRGYAVPEGKEDEALALADRVWATPDRKEWAGRPCFAVHERAFVPCAAGMWDFVHRSVFECGCPMCGASPGEPCIQFSGPRPGTFMRRDHRPRRLAYLRLKYPGWGR